jgi:hypothetical protein
MALFLGLPRESILFLQDDRDHVRPIRVSDIVGSLLALPLPLKCFLAYSTCPRTHLVLLFVAPPSSLLSSFLPCMHFPELHASTLAHSEILLESDTITYGMVLHLV